MAPRILVFAGAPLPSSLNWESDTLIESFSAPFIQFAQLDNAQSHVPLPPATNEYVRWRSLRLADEPLQSSQFRAYALPDEYVNTAGSVATDSLASSFYTDQDLSSIPDIHPATEFAQDATSLFYEDSLAVYENLPSSPVPALGLNKGALPPGTDAGNTTSNTTSFSTSYGLSFNSHSTIPPKGNLPVPNGGRLTGLAHIPNAGYLQSIQPQTMTVNVIVGIISISPPRSIQTRAGLTLEIVELLVGDETRSGFGINCWLPVGGAPKNIGDHPNLRSSLSGLRPQDIILLRNVALSSFRKKVYGQSLRRDVTKVDLLFRNRIDREDEGGCYSAEDLNSTIGNPADSQAAKAMRVREWVLRFVGHGGGALRRTAGKVEVGEQLPPDTQ